MAAMKAKVQTSEDVTPPSWRWLRAKRLTYTDRQGRKRFWESAERATRSERYSLIGNEIKSVMK